MSTGAKTVMAEEENKQPEIVSKERHGDRGPRDRDRGRRRHRNPPRHLEASINMNELRELIGLITDNGLTQFELEREGFRVKIGRQQAYEEAVPAISLPGAEKQLASGAATQSGSAVQSIPSAASSHPGAHAEEAASEDQDLFKITSPIVGTFYRAPSPTAESFVRIGSSVEPQTVVCIIEAM